MAKAAKVVSEAEGYVAHWQEVLGLQNWRIIVTAEKAGSGSIAECIHPSHYRKARITIDLTPKNSWNLKAQLTGKLLEQTMLHELIHLLLAPVRDFWDDELSGGSIWKQYANAQETVVDELTSVMWRITRA
jgi:hypothetical protein